MATHSKYDITEFDAVTNQSIVRPMTDEEQSNHEIVMADVERQKELVAEKATAKQAVLDKLGLTADEVTALLG
jgi:hypothetical protein